MSQLVKVKPTSLEILGPGAAPVELSDREKEFLTQASKLFNDDFYDHALLDVWNAAVAEFFLGDGMTTEYGKNQVLRHADVAEQQPCPAVICVRSDSAVATRSQFVSLS
jgi:hypothetical protein